jgi:hypothetical protein
MDIYHKGKHFVLYSSDAQIVSHQSKQDFAGTHVLCGIFEIGVWATGEILHMTHIYTLATESNPK